MKVNYYHTLGLDNFSSVEQVKLAYRKLAKKYHPDINPGQQGNEIFIRLATAYRVLSNEQNKATYDLKLYVYLNPPKKRVRHKTQGYAKRKIEYSKKAKFYGIIFITGLVLFVICMPLGLTYYAGINHFNNGLKSYHEGKIANALIYFDEAIGRFSPKSVEAAEKAALISYYDLHNHSKAIVFINKGLKYAKEEEKASLYYLNAISINSPGKYKKALINLHLADSLGYNTDSIQYHMALIQTFGLENYREGKRHFDYLINNKVNIVDARLGRAWCYQHMHNFKAAIADYTELIKEGPTQKVAYYYRAMNLLTLQDTLSACDDLYKAMKLGHKTARRHYNNNCP